MDLSLDADVSAARSGDPNAFARLVSRYRGLVSSLSLSTVCNVATSEDVAQEVFLAVWRDLGTLRNPASFLPWLRQLTRHRALDALRRSRGGAVQLSDVLADTVVDARPDAQQVLLAEERTRALTLALAELPDAAREVLTLYYREGQSIAQVARLLELHEDAVKQRLSRARAALREDVLARFVEVVERSTPGEGFTRQVMLGVPLASPPASFALGKGAIVAGKSGAAAATMAAWLSTVFGVLTLARGLRRDLLAALDERERRALRRIAAVGMLNMVAFGVGVMMLPPRGPETSLARAWLGTACTLAFTVIHLSLYLVWYPRAKARRRAAEVAADPAAAARHTRDARQARLAVLLACGLIALVIAAIWGFR
ncbi:MAG: hypothetical protein RL033_8134 [Pseudomonadota bacterium]|jgi:RNA polymerase sigma factor (sigma-70 family)